MLLDQRFELKDLLKARQGVETYLAEDIGSGRSPVMVTLVRRSVAAADLVPRLEHDAMVLARLQDPSFRPLLHFGNAEDAFYLVQPYLQGSTLADRLESGPLTVDETMRVARDLLHSLDHAHDLGILHRDINPGSIILRTGADGSGASFEEAVLIDFGLSFSASLDPVVKQEAVGAARYLAPEQAGSVDAAVDRRSDLYSVGVVLYECLAGSPPFAAASVGEVLRQHLNMAVPGLRAEGVQAPRALGQIALVLAPNAG